MAGDSPQMSALPEAVQVRRALHVGEALLQPSVANEAGASALGKGGLCVLPPTHRTCEKKTPDHHKTRGEKTDHSSLLGLSYRCLAG